MRHAMMLVCCCCLPVLGALAAEPAPARTKAEIDQRLSELAKRQLELSFSLQEQALKNDTLWLNPKFTSPEIAALRKRYEALKSEMATVQAQLREQVEALPEVLAELDKIGQQKEEYQALARQMTELKRKREQAP